MEKVEKVCLAGWQDPGGRREGAGSLDPAEHVVVRAHVVIPVEEVAGEGLVVEVAGEATH